MSAVRFERRDPEEPPASELLAEMRAELNDVYETFSRLDNPPLSPAELRPPGGVYLVGYEAGQAVAGGGLRHLDEGVAEIKRMYVRPAARSRGVARDLLQALEDAAASLGYDGDPSGHRTQAGPRRGALPQRGLRGGAALQRQPVRLFLGGEATRMSGARPIPKPWRHPGGGHGSPRSVRRDDPEAAPWRDCTVAA